MNNTLKLVLSASLVLGALVAPKAKAAVPAEKAELVQQLKKQRGGKALGPRIGKKVQKAFELYSADDIKGGLEILLEVDAKDDFDKAYIDRFIGNMYAQEGQVDLALKHLTSAKDIDELPFDDHKGVLKLIADLSIQEKKYEDALVNYQAFLDFSHDEDPNVYLRIANAHYELKNYDAVLAPARKAITLYEKPNQNPYVLVMASYYERKMYPEATKAVEDLVKTFPDNAKWWTQLGMFYMLTEDYQRGLSTMEVAHKQGFLTTQSQVKQLAQLYASNGIPYKAAIIQDEFIASGLIKKTEQTLSVMASTYQNAKEYAKAAKYFGEAAKIENDADLYRKQGTAYMVMERFDKAVEAFDKALKFGIKRKGPVYMGIAEAQFYLENWKESYAAIQEAKKDKNSAKSAAGWEGYIKDTASRKGTVL
ncbi:tetratricopeptide repeat protein [Psychrosphaera algicola]|uniref:Tetratricopeptide repeat protein n=1 Tax=Psychrosphaera algicola TaxID=3023714 RepID=A0ABT5FII5_9GAMM|nr:tetratricopeptide repeat protein [Psychrosphaera sp. G1-22]MDC2891015.1 hypothetical protein [Psychrosphaera sp. G1-22]